MKARCRTRHRRSDGVDSAFAMVRDLGIADVLKERIGEQGGLRRRGYRAPLARKASGNIRQCRYDVSARTTSYCIVQGQHCSFGKESGRVCRISRTARFHPCCTNPLSLRSVVPLSCFSQIMSPTLGRPPPTILSKSRGFASFPGRGRASSRCISIWILAGPSGWNVAWGSRRRASTPSRKGCRHYVSAVRRPNICTRRRPKIVPPGSLPSAAMTGTGLNERSRSPSMRGALKTFALARTLPRHICASFRFAKASPRGRHGSTSPVHLRSCHRRTVASLPRDRRVTRASRSVSGSRRCGFFRSPLSSEAVRVLRSLPSGAEKRNAVRTDRYLARRPELPGSIMVSASVAATLLLILPRYRCIAFSRFGAVAVPWRQAGPRAKSRKPARPSSNRSRSAAVL